jgi:hypothetical protein
VSVASAAAIVPVTVSMRRPKRSTIQPAIGAAVPPTSRAKL